MQNYVQKQIQKKDLHDHYYEQMYRMRSLNEWNYSKLNHFASQNCKYFAIALGGSAYNSHQE